MKVKRSDGTTVKPGDMLFVDGNYPVTFVRAAAPADGPYAGLIVVRWSWGAEDRIEENRAFVTVSD